MVYFLDVGVDYNQWSKPYFYTLLGPVQQPKIETMALLLGPNASECIIQK